MLMPRCPTVAAHCHRRATGAAKEALPRIWHCIVMRDAISMHENMKGTVLMALHHTWRDICRDLEAVQGLSKGF